MYSTRQDSTWAHFCQWSGPTFAKLSNGVHLISVRCLLRQRIFYQKLTKYTPKWKQGILVFAFFLRVDTPFWHCDNLCFSSDFSDIVDNWIWTLFRGLKWRRPARSTQESFCYPMLSWLASWRRGIFLNLPNFSASAPSPYGILKNWMGSNLY